LPLKGPLPYGLHASLGASHASPLQAANATPPPFMLYLPKYVTHSNQSFIKKHFFMSFLPEWH
jgi:hypothetical protein